MCRYMQTDFACKHFEQSIKTPKLRTAIPKGCNRKCESTSSNTKRSDSKRVCGKCNKEASSGNMNAAAAVGNTMPAAAAASTVTRGGAPGQMASNGQGQPRAASTGGRITTSATTATVRTAAQTAGARPAGPQSANGQPPASQRTKTTGGPAQTRLVIR